MSSTSSVLDEVGFCDLEIEPALTKIELAMEKVNNLINSKRLKCDSCDFKAKNQNGLNMHKKAKHGDKAPSWIFLFL